MKVARRLQKSPNTNRRFRVSCMPIVLLARKKEGGSAGHSVDADYLNKATCVTGSGLELILRSRSPSTAVLESLTQKLSGLAQTAACRFTGRVGQDQDAHALVVRECLRKPDNLCSQRRGTRVTLQTNTQQRDNPPKETNKRTFWNTPAVLGAFSCVARDTYPFRCPDEGSLHLRRVPSRHLHEQQPVLVRKSLSLRRGYAPPAEPKENGGKRGMQKYIRHKAAGTDPESREADYCSF